MCVLLCCHNKKCITHTLFNKKIKQSQARSKNEVIHSPTDHMDSSTADHHISSSHHMHEHDYHHLIPKRPQTAKTSKDALKQTHVTQKQRPHTARTGN